MDLNLDDKTPEIYNTPNVPSISRISEKCQYKKSENIEIKNSRNTEYWESSKISHVISPQDYEGLFKFRQTVNT